MTASPAAVLVGSFLSNRFFGFGFWAIDLVLLLAIAGVVVALATDDRDPSTVLAWLFVVLLLPVLGLVAYFFIGRNFRRDTPRRQRIMARMEAVAETSLGPVTAANAGVHRDGHRRPGRHARRASSSRIGRTEGGVRAAAGRHRRGLHRRRAEVRPRCSPRWRRAERYIHLMYLIWEQDELTAKVTDVLLERCRPASRCASSTTG